MWNIFEHYKFLKHLFNFRNDVVVECSTISAIGSVLVNGILIIMDWYKYFADNILGVSVFFITMIFIIMLVDLCSGLAASKKEGQKRTSKKGLRWVFKFGSYVLFIYVINAFVKEVVSMGHDWLYVPLNVIKLYMLFHIVMWETKSIEENITRMGYNARIFGIIDTTFKNIKKIFSKQGINTEDNNDTSGKK